MLLLPLLLPHGSLAVNCRLEPCVVPTLLWMGLRFMLDPFPSLRARRSTFGMASTKSPDLYVAEPILPSSTSCNNICLLLAVVSRSGMEAAERDGRTHGDGTAIDAQREKHSEALPGSVNSSRSNSIRLLPTTSRVNYQSRAYTSATA